MCSSDLAWSGFERIESPQRDLSAGPVPPPELPDPLLEYRTSLLRMLTLSAEELQQPKTRFERARSLFQTGQAEQALVELDWLNEKQPSATVLQFRTLALGQLGKADEAATAFAAYKLLAPSKSEEDYVAIQLAAWKKDAVAVGAALAAAPKSYRANGDDLYNIA